MSSGSRCSRSSARCWSPTPGGGPRCRQRAVRRHHGPRRAGDRRGWRTSRWCSTRRPTTSRRSRAALAWLAAGGEPSTVSLAAPRPRRPDPGRVLAVDRAHHGRRRSRPSSRSRWSSRSSSGGGGVADDAERVAVRWLGLGLAWTAAFLTFAATGPGDGRPGPPERPLPRVRRPDGVHARRDRGSGRMALVAGGPGRAPAPSPIAIVLARRGWPSPSWASVGWNVAHLPPAIARDGGFPAAAAAARADPGGDRATGRSRSAPCPTFKSPDTLRLPARPRRGADRGRGRRPRPGHRVRRPLRRGDRGAVRRPGRRCLARGGALRRLGDGRRRQDRPADEVRGRARPLGQRVRRAS